jgi:hypothetical protein
MCRVTDYGKCMYQVKQGTNSREALAAEERGVTVGNSLSMHHLGQSVCYGIYALHGGEAMGETINCLVCVLNTRAVANGWGNRGWSGISRRCGV